MTLEEKNILINEIKLLINSDDTPLVEINPKLLDYFTDDELVALRDDLIVKKRDVMKNNAQWLNDIYEKTKKDEL